MNSHLLQLACSIAAPFPMLNKPIQHGKVFFISLSNTVSDIYHSIHSFMDSNIIQQSAFFHLTCMMDSIPWITYDEYFDKVIVDIKNFRPDVIFVDQVRVGHINKAVQDFLFYLYLTRDAKNFFYYVQTKE